MDETGPELIPLAQQDALGDTHSVTSLWGHLRFHLLLFRYVSRPGSCWEHAHEIPWITQQTAKKKKRFLAFTEDLFLGQSFSTMASIRVLFSDEIWWIHKRAQSAPAMVSPLDLGAWRWRWQIAPITEVIIGKYNSFHRWFWYINYI